MEHKPSDQMLTKIDAFILRQLEMNNGLKKSELEERIFSRYGFNIDVDERLKNYITPEQDNNFLYWN